MTLLEHGLIVMLLGMCVVFLFLILLVYATTFMSRFVQYLNGIWPEPLEETAPSLKSVNDEEAIAVAIAAVMRQGC